MAENIVAGLPISHPDRLIYPDLNISKIDLARYYEAVGPRMLPHVEGRPLTLVHCPNGLASACNYLRHGKAWGPKALRRVAITEKTKTGEYLVADSVEAIVALAQIGVVEVHTWNATDDDIERPDRVMWDLDPGPEVEWQHVVRAAYTVRDLLDSMGLKTWVKTTGGKGLHVVAPIVRQRDWSECLAFAKAVAEALSRSDRTYTTTFAKKDRDDKILIDYLRNNRTNTAVAAFSARARDGATVSMPVSWHDLDKNLEPAAYTVLNVPKMRGPDPWREYWKSHQKISARVFNAIQRMAA